MNFKSKIKKYIVLESVKWVGISLSILIVILINYVGYNVNLYIKNLLVLILLFLISVILCTTKLGKFMIEFGKESYLELQKVIWPSYQDSLNMTLIVVTVTIIISLMLWGLDTLLVNLISLGLRL